MIALLLLFAALWIAGGFGRLLIGRTHVLEESALERFPYACALGLGIGAYGVFFLGLCGLLSFWPVTLWWLALGVLGIGGMRANTGDITAALRRMKTPRNPATAVPRRFAFLPAAAILVLLACGVIAALACFQPPTGHEWDALAYHLADPKLFLFQHRITSLPTEHHSNFPFTMEMLFAVGLLYASYPLANLFHFAMAVLTVLAIIGFCRRRLSVETGYLASLLFVTTPLVLWEASVAYIDLGLGLYTTLAAFAAVSAIHRDSNEERARVASVPSRESCEWAGLAGVTMGLALGIKYLALVPFALIGLLLLARRAPWRAVAVYASLALLIGAPWYLKNLVVTHNPVYPYAFSLFPQSRYWSADRATIYTSEQSHFGAPHSLRQPEDTIRNLIQTPWYLITNAAPYTNVGDYTFTSLIGGLYAAFCLAFAFLRRVPRVILDLYLLALLQLIAWFFISQVIRYLVAILPLLAVVAGYTAWRLLQPDTDQSQGEQHRVSLWQMLSCGIVGAALLGQSTLLLWSVFALPTGGRAAYEMGALPTALSVPDVVNGLIHPEERERSLAASLDTYAAMQWINASTPSDSRVLLYDDTRGFYLDRGYLWGNGEHSSYIPYERMRDSRDFADWLARLGSPFRWYALIDMNWSPERGRDQTFPNGPNGQEPAALNRWYADIPVTPTTPHWRLIIRDGLQRNAWRLVYAEHGVAVLEIAPPDRTARTESRLPAKGESSS